MRAIDKELPMLVQTVHTGRWYGRICRREPSCSTSTTCQDATGFRIQLAAARQPRWPLCFCRCLSKNALRCTISMR